MDISNKHLNIMFEQGRLLAYEDILDEIEKQHSLDDIKEHLQKQISERIEFLENENIKMYR